MCGSRQRWGSIYRRQAKGVHGLLWAVSTRLRHWEQEGGSRGKRVGSEEEFTGAENQGMGKGRSSRNGKKGGKSWGEKEDHEMTKVRNSFLRYSKSFPCRKAGGKVMKIRAEGKGSHSAKAARGYITEVSQQFWGSNWKQEQRGLRNMRSWGFESQRTDLNLERKENLKLIIKIQRRLLTDSWLKNRLGRGKTQKIRVCCPVSWNGFVFKKENYATGRRDFER